VLGLLAVGSLGRWVSAMFRYELSVYTRMLCSRLHGFKALSVLYPLSSIEDVARMFMFHRRPSSNTVNTWFVESTNPYPSISVLSSYRIESTIHTQQHCNKQLSNLPIIRINPFDANNAKSIADCVLSERSLLVLIFILWTCTLRTVPCQPRHIISYHLIS
jgi:hypothetical protein